MSHRIFHLLSLCMLSGFILSSDLVAEAPVKVEPLPVADAVATNQSEMKPYAEPIEHTELKIEMVPIPGGELLMGSPDDDSDAEDNEKPQHDVWLAGAGENVWGCGGSWGDLNILVLPAAVPVTGVAPPPTPLPPPAPPMPRQP